MPRFLQVQGHPCMDQNWLPTPKTPLHFTLPKTNILPLKMDGWKTTLLLVGNDHISPTVSGNVESMVFLFLGFLFVPRMVLSVWGILGPIFRGELLVWGSVESHIWRHTHLHVCSWVHPSLDESIGQLYLKWTDIITRKWITMDGGRIHT